MPLNDTERLVLKANRLLKTPEEKIRFVNGKLGYLDDNGILIEKFKKESMKHANFYRTLARIQDRKRTRKRFQDVGKSFLYDVLNTLELYETISDDTEKDIELASGRGQLMLANQLRRTLIELQPYITALREDIRELLEEGELSVAETEDFAFTAFRESQEGEGKISGMVQESS